LNVSRFPFFSCRTFERYADLSEDQTLADATIWNFMGTFLKVSIGSLGIGVATALGCSFVSSFHCAFYVTFRSMILRIFAAYSRKIIRTTNPENLPENE